MVHSLSALDQAAGTQVRQAAGRLAPLLPANDLQRLVAPHPQQIGPGALRLSQSVRARGDTDQSGCNRILGIVAVAGNRRCKTDQPDGSQIVQPPQRRDTTFGQAVGAQLDAFRKPVQRGHQ